MRRTTGVRKSGHGGTLDPAAEGVLLICLGAATKLVEALMDQPKVYRTTIRLDVTSESFDADRPLIPAPINLVPTREEVALALRGIESSTMQAPPAISALKVGGRRAYQRQRAGEDFVLAPRPVKIYWIVLHRCEWPLIDIELACGRGTYVRAIARDLGLALAVGGCLTGLVRRAIGPFRIEDSVTLDALDSSADWRSFVTEMSTCRSLLSERHAPVKPAQLP